MTAEQLEKELKTVISDFDNNIKTSFDLSSKKPATVADVAELAHSTLDALGDFEKSLIKFLKANR